MTIFGDDFYQKSPVSPKSKGLANQHIFHQISVGVAPLFSQIIQDGTLPPMDPKQESEGNQWGWVYGTKGRLTRFLSGIWGFMSIVGLYGWGIWKFPDTYHFLTMNSIYLNTLMMEM